jgi:hypothetical protein
VIARALRSLSGWLFRLAARLDKGKLKPMAAAQVQLLWADRTPTVRMSERPTLEVPTVATEMLMADVTPLPEFYQRNEFQIPPVRGAFDELTWDGKDGQ